MDIEGPVTQQILVPDPLIGARLGEYEVLEVIGEGGMGIVYRGIQPVIKKRVAIKVMKPEMAGDATHVRRLVAEAEAVNAIGHRNIIDIFGLGMLPDGRPYIVMEYLVGQALDQYLHAHARPPLHETLAMLIDIAGPLGAAHHAGVVHRDLKPSNVFLCAQADGSRFVKLLDFGLAKRTMSLDGVMHQTNQALIAGTPDYMAPEQARGMAISARTDLYALGVMAWRMVTGELPYTGHTSMDVMMAQVHAPVPPLLSRVPETPPALSALVERMMAKAPEARPESADEVRQALIAIADTLTFDGYQPLEVRPRISAPPRQSGPRPAGLVTPSPPVKVSPPETADTILTGEVKLPSPSRLPWAVAGGVVAVAVGLVAWSLATPKPPPAPPLPPVPVVAAVLKPAPPPEPVVVVDAGVAVAPPDAAVAVESPVVDAGAPEVLDAGHAPVVAAPSSEQLLARVGRLETALAAALARGADIDPAAAPFLNKYRVQANLAQTGPERLKLSRALDTWERSFLK